MTDGLYGVKDLYQGALLASTPVTINGVDYQENDVILFFDSIQEVAFRENSSSRSATGGFDNRQLVNWTTTQTIDGAIYNGRVSRAGYGIINKTILEKIPRMKNIRQFDQLSSDDSGKVFLRHKPLEDLPIKVFRFESGVLGSQILDYELDEDTLILKEQDTDVLVDYWFAYTANANSVRIGQRSLGGYLKFVGKFYYTDEQTSSPRTALIEIPKIEIESDLDLSFGRNTSPLVSVLRFKAIPVGARDNSLTMSIIYLDDDIDEDI